MEVDVITGEITIIEFEPPLVETTTQSETSSDPNSPEQNSNM
jgi:short-subunit dehydrogenase involved in D-alanine esterification of teichoic acids